MGYINLSITEFSKVTNRTVEVLTYALRIAKSAYMEYEKVQILTLIARLQLRMNLPQNALASVVSVIDQIHINGGLYDRSKVDFLLVRCLLAAADNIEEKKKRLLKSVPILDRSIDGFRTLDAHGKILDIYAFLAQAFNEVGIEESRNLYSCKFRRYYISNAVPSGYLNMPY